MNTHAVAASSDAAGIQPDEGGSQPTLLLHSPEDFSHRRYAIRPVLSVTAANWLDRWHYLRRMAGSATYYGVFAPDLGAIVAVGQPNNDHGIAGKFGLESYQGNLEISRVARHPAFGVETSKILRLVLRQIADEGVEWVYSYADPKAGHHGGIYQALGAIYLGLSQVAYGWQWADGTSMHPRTAVARFGTNASAFMSSVGASKVYGMFGGLHTYVIPLARRDEIQAALAPFIRPYPKRVAS